MRGTVEYSHLDEHRRLFTENRYAATIVFNILDRILTIDSLLDLGCGIGVWMQAASAKPGRAVLGIDRETFAPEELAVPSETIVNTTLDRTIELHRRFDMVLCLETAEHIEHERAVDLVSNCTRHSNIVLFSAAIPGQGGLHHVNEQPPEYWQGLFEQAGYDVVDLIRPLIWREARIPVWYRQNMLLFVNRKDVSTLSLLHTEASRASVPLGRAHIDLFHWQAQELTRCKADLEAALAQHARTLDEFSHVLARAEEEKSECLRAKQRSEELHADLAAQRDYSGRTMSKAWLLIQQVNTEREAQRAQLRATEFEKDRLGGRLASVEGALAQAMKDQLEWRQTFLSSGSWRVTAPLRALYELLQRRK